MDRTERVIEICRPLLDGQPRNAVVHLLLAQALTRAERVEEALQSYRRACADDPSLAEAHAGLAAALQQCGQIQEAEASLERAIAMDPEQPRYYRALAFSKKLECRETAFLKLTEMARDMSGLEERDQIEIHFAMSRALADNSRNEEAFDHLLAGNSLKRRNVNYNEAAELGFIDRMSTVFNGTFIDARRGYGAATALPIFIVGMPRSGSTLVEQILASHPKVAGGGELRAMENAVAETDSSAAVEAEAFSAWDHKRFEQTSGLYLRHLQRAAEAAGGAETALRITDKRLANFRYIGLINIMYPNARIIHTVRDPVDTCLSCFSLPFAVVNFSYDLGELGRRYKAYQRLMSHWESTLPPGTVLHINYRDIVLNTEAETRRLLAHCGLEWHDDCRQFYQTQRSVRTASVLQVRRPIYRSSLKRWRPDDTVLRPLLDALA